MGKAAMASSTNHSIIQPDRATPMPQRDRNNSLSSTQIMQHWLTSISRSLTLPSSPGFSLKRYVLRHFARNHRDDNADLQATVGIRVAPS
jgi:hypothetical protein